MKEVRYKFSWDDSFNFLSSNSKELKWYCCSWLFNKMRLLISWCLLVLCVQGSSLPKYEEGSFMQHLVCFCKHNLCYMRALEFMREAEIYSLVKSGRILKSRIVRQIEKGLICYLVIISLKQILLFSPSALGKKRKQNKIMLTFAFSLK